MNGLYVHICILIKIHVDDDETMRITYKGDLSWLNITENIKDSSRCYKNSHNVLIDFIIYQDLKRNRI